MALRPEPLDLFNGMLFSIRLIMLYIDRLLSPISIKCLTVNGFPFCLFFHKIVERVVFSKIHLVIPSLELRGLRTYAFDILKLQIHTNRTLYSLLSRALWILFYGL